MRKKDIIEAIISKNGDIRNWGWDSMGVYDPNYSSEKFEGSEIYKMRYDEGFMSDVARDYFEWFDSVCDIISFCDKNGFLY